MNIFKKIRVSFYKALAYIFYYYGVLFQYFNVSKADQAMNDMWLCSLFFDLKSGNQNWREIGRHHDGAKIWKPIRDKEDLFILIEPLDNSSLKSLH